MGSINNTLVQLVVQVIQALYILTNLSILPIIEKGVLQSLNIIMDLSILPFILVLLVFASCILIFVIRCKYI